MAMKTMYCHSLGGITPLDEFKPINELVQFDVNGNITHRTSCDPDKSYVYEMLPNESPMGEEEFNELWPLILLLLIVGVLAKYTLRMFNMR